MPNESVTAEDIKSRAYEGMCEDTVCTRLLIPYITDILGWHITDVDDEYTVHESRGKEVDYAVPSTKNPELLIEAKSLETNVEDEIGQLSEYLDLSDVDLGLITNGLQYIVVERVENKSNNIVCKFNITEQPPEYICADYNSESIEFNDNNRSVFSFFEDISDSAPHNFPQRLVEPSCIQYQSGIDDFNPIHMYLSIDETISAGFRDYLLSQYKNLIYLKNRKRGESILRNSSSPNVIVFDNIGSNEKIDCSTFSKNFRSIIVDESTGLPKNVPAIILDVPKDGVWNEFDPIPEQIQMKQPTISNVDLVYTIKDEQTNEKNSHIAERYFNGNDFSEMDIVPNEESNSNSVGSMNEEARDYIQDFFVSIRSNDFGLSASPNMIDSLVNITKIIASIDTSSAVQKQHAERAKEIVTKSLKDVGYDEKVGRFDVDMSETEQSTSQSKRRNIIIEVIEENEDEGERGAPEQTVVDIMVDEYEYDKDKVKHDLKKMGREGKKIYEPANNEFSTM